MILVDTSVWIDYFKGIETQETNFLDLVLSHEDAAIGDLILLEILQGFRNDKDYELAKQSLAALYRSRLPSIHPTLEASGSIRSDITPHLEANNCCLK